MKTIKLNFLLVIMALGVFTFTSCEDEFTEEDFLDKQAELAAAQQNFNLEKLILEYQLIRENDSLMKVFSAELANVIKDENTEALRQAGLLSSYTVTVENQGGAPLEGVTVSVGGSNPAARVDAVTDATGQVIIQDIVIGTSPVQVTLAGFVGVSYMLDLGRIDAEEDYFQVGDRIYPLGRRETSRITLLSADGASGTFGTVKGTATIETDVTNLASEVPQDVTIVAYLNGTSFSGGGATGFYNTSATMSDFRFIGEGIGSAVVDNTTGAWSMLLPATEGGITYNFQLPTITADQRIAIDERDDAPIAPEFATVPTMFGPAAGTYDYVNAVSGARAVFAAAPAQGTGFALTFAQVARGLDLGTATSLSAEEVSIAGGTSDVYRLTSRGSALSTSPTGTAVGGNGTGTAATFTTAIAGRLTALGIATAGTGYAVGNTFNITVTPQTAAAANATTDINGPSVVGAATNFTFQISVASIGGGGEITGVTLPTTGLGFDSDAYFGTSVTQYAVVVAPVTVAGGSSGTADFTVAGVSASVSSFTVATAGTLYTGAPTSITFAGGGGVGGTPVLPSLSLVGMSFDYTITPSGGTGYAVLPSMSVNTTTTLGGGLSTSGTVNTLDGAATSTASLIGEFTLAGGVPTLKNSTLLVYRTGRSFTTPTAVITTLPSTTAMATVSIGAGATNLGQVTGITQQGNESGYAAPFGVTIEPSVATAPGSGAVVSLGGFSAPTANLEVTWNGTNTVTQAGSGYLPTLNQAFGTGGGQTNFSGNFNQTVISGETYNRDIVYGTGNRTQNVD